MRYPCAVFLLVFLTAACAGGAASSVPTDPPPTTPPYPVGQMTDQTLVVGGVTRQFRVHVPAGTTTPKAVVFVLHGGGGEGLDVSVLGQHALSVFRTVADREGFVVVYPAGLPANDAQRLVGWVDCRADNTVASAADDIGFLAALVERVRTAYGLTSARMFMTGGSNGAQMTHAFAFNRADLVGAVATGSGSLPVTPKTGGCATGPSRPLPIMILHGSGDTQMPWGGGCVADIGGNCNRGRVISAEATRDRWLQINGLGGVTPTTTVVDSSAADAGPASRFDYPGAAPVRWWRLDGAGHTAPSRTVLSPPNPVTGIQNRDIEFAEIVWAFFKARLPLTIERGGRAIRISAEIRRATARGTPRQPACSAAPDGPFRCNLCVGARRTCVAAVGRIWVARCARILFRSPAAELRRYAGRADEKRSWASISLGRRACRAPLIGVLG